MRAVRGCALLILVEMASASFPKRDTLPNASYPHYPDREVWSLSGLWDFAFINYTNFNASESSALPADLNFDKSQKVPSAWDARWGTGLQYSRGAGFYRTNVTLPAGQYAALHFEACSMFCQVFVDGKLIKNHTAGGFTPFWAQVPVSSQSERTITVLASNVFDSVLTPTQAKNYDFYQYGGLIREVTLHALGTTAHKDGTPVEPSILQVIVDPLADETGAPSGEVNVTAVLRAYKGLKSQACVKVPLGLCWDGICNQTAPTEFTGRLDSSNNCVIALPGLAVPRWKAWSLESPALHTLTVKIFQQSSISVLSSKVSDSIVVRFGLRVVQASGRDIKLNGKPVKLHGFNRHDMYPQLGPSLPSALIDSDLILLKTKLNGNFIRGSHYPQDPRMLDKCDEIGILVWEEALAWGNYASVLTNPYFLNASHTTARSMLARDSNHPSIIIWGFFNEGQSDNEVSKPAYESMSKIFKTDRTRLVTWADNRGEKSLCYEYADVISNNYYPGWYNGPSSDIQKTWSDRAQWVSNNYPDKPFIISETGAGGIVGERSSNLSRWSEDYQRVVDRLNAEVAIQDPNIAGISLWQYADIKVDQSNTSTGRPGGINNKGVVSRFRSPKLAAEAVAAIFAGKVV